MGIDTATPIESLLVICYPDARLRKTSVPVEAFDDDLRRLADRMLALMADHRGVGLAAPQVGVNLRLFVCNPSGEPDGQRVYVNPVITEMVGAAEGDEGCLSLPDVTVPIRRAPRCRLRAFDLTGTPLEREGQDLDARVWQHEVDHLDGILIIDKMPPASKIAVRRILKRLDEAHRAAAQ